jgi:hypothetical protein
MAQTLISVVLEVQPQNAEQLRGLITQLRKDQSATVPAYAGMQAIRSLHFLAMTVFADDQYDPILVLEANFDPPAGPFWADLETAIGPQLRDMLRLCKRPRGRTGEMFDVVTGPGSKSPIAPLLESLTVAGIVRHQGNRGVSRERIEREAQLFLDVRKELKKPARFEGLSAAEVHAALRGPILQRHTWLASDPAPPISGWENFVDWARLIAVALAIVLILHAPGMLLASILPTRWALAVILIAAAAAGFALYAMRGGPPTKPRSERAKPIRRWNLLQIVPILLIALAAALVFELGFSLLITTVSRWLVGSGDAGANFAMTVVGLFGAFPTLGLLLMGLRHIEEQEPSQDAPPVDSQKLRDIVALEDRLGQNHMASLVHIKPGVMRAILARIAVHGLAIHLGAQSAARNGFLGAIRSIHFAQLTFVSNGGRLMFLTNFDGSWESYLSDFIDRVHGAVTWVWTSTVGFPSTRFMVLDGASQDRQFKAWKRHAMAPSLFWFSAYRALSVEQIKRNARIAEGLRQAVLKPKEAVQWSMDL